MEYFTGLKRLVLPEYGRNIQNMVDHALTIENREERTRCAKSIINLMGNMFPYLRNVEDFKYKLWDHLAIMADFKLDIDYPYEIVRKENLYTRPDIAPYKSGRIKYRHYGMVIENMITKIADFPEDSPERDHLIQLLANHMKKSFISWNKENVDDAKIFQDFSDYTNGKIVLTPDKIKLFDTNANNQRKNKINPKKHGK